MMKQADKIKEVFFRENGDERGKLVAIEGLKDIPFEIKRIFYIYAASSDVIRGCHANRYSEFILINICGSSKVKVNDGMTEKIFILDKPCKGIYIPNMVWKEMYDFSPDSVLLAVTNKPYDAHEYIRNYKDYLKEVNNFE
jgi:dTDP-4-dehydrorhamnose 3,5-epimerase-like enzyme